MNEKTLFDDWPERYDNWFSTPIGKLVYEYESKLVLKLLNSKPGEWILDAGCGTGIFTMEFLIRGARVTGVDISQPMLDKASRRAMGLPFQAIRADMLQLPFKSDSFDKSVSITALEFIADGKTAVDELFRVTRPGGRVVVATLNSLSPWAERRLKKTETHILEHAYFRSPVDLLALSPYEGKSATAVFFHKDEDPSQAGNIEKAAQLRELSTGAFVAVSWDKPL